MNIIWNLLLLSIAVYLIARFIPGIHVKNFGTAIGVAVVYSIVNFFLGWLLTMLALPFMIITFGLFKFVLNAIMLWITDKILDNFKIDSLGLTLLAAFLITLLDSLFHWIF